MPGSRRSAGNNRLFKRTGGVRANHRVVFFIIEENETPHLTNSVATEHPSKHRRNTSVTALRLYDHCNMMIYCSTYSLLTPRNGRRKFRSPVQIPSMVLQCTSRTPSPSSSRAYSPWLWLTVACQRPRRASGLYPLHSSVYTIAPGLVAGRTVASTNSSARLRCPTRAHSRPLVRPTAAGTGRYLTRWIACKRTTALGVDPRSVP